MAQKWLGFLMGLVLNSVAIIITQIILTVNPVSILLSTAALIITAFILIVNNNTDKRTFGKWLLGGAVAAIPIVYITSFILLIAGGGMC